MRILQYELQRTPNSRAALSLLGYCYYTTQDFAMAAECYDKLTQISPEHTDYKLYHAQALYNAFMFPEAIAVLSTIDDPKMVHQVVKLDSAIKYREEDLSNARILVDQYEPDDPDTEVNLACLDYKEGNYQQALQRFLSTTETHGYVADLYYAIALCYYNMGSYSQAQKYISEIIKSGIKDYPELGVGMVTEGMDVRSVGNSLLLHETALIEACNLKFAIDYKNKDMDAAREALTDMPPRSEEELDPVTLHNQALINIESNLADSFAKLQYLLSQNPFPPETFANLLLLYCKYEYFDLAADVLAENAHLTYRYLSQYMYDYLDALISQQSSVDEAYQKFDAIATDQTSNLRKVMGKIQQAKEDMNEDEQHAAEEEYEMLMERFIPVIMTQAKIEWDRGRYEALERVWHRWSEYCAKSDVFKLNVAHTLFMMEKYKESAGFYSPLIAAVENNDSKDLLDISAIAVANLCVCWVMMNQNEYAELLMNKVKLAEEQSAEKKQFHTCIIHLVIGTLYCSKSNSEFGIARIIEALQPGEKTLGIDTWFYTKRCILSVFESMAKQLTVMRDDVMMTLIHTLENCESKSSEKFYY